MRISKQFMTLIAICCIGLCAALALYSNFVLKERQLATISSGQKLAVSLLSDSINTFIRQTLSSNIEEIDEYYLNLKNEANKAFKTEDQRSIDFLGMNYFLNNNDKEQIFSSKSKFPKGEDCTVFLGLPESLRSLLKHHHSEVLNDNYRCYLYGSHQLFGYIKDGLSDNLHLLFLKKINDPLKIQSFPLQELISQAFASLDQIQEQDISLAVLDSQGQIIKKSPGYDALHFDPALLHPEKIADKEALRRSSVIFESEYLEELNTYIVAVTATSPINKAYYIFGGIALALGVLLAFFLISKCAAYNRRNYACRTKIIDAVTDFGKHNLNELANQNIPNIPAAMGETLYPLDTALKETGNKLFTKYQNVVAAHKEELKECGEEQFKKGSEHASLEFRKFMIPSNEDLPSSKFMDIGSFFIPSPDPTKVSDFYDIFRIDKDNIAFIMGCCQKPGMTSLRIMNECSAVIRRVVQQEGLRPSDAMNAAKKMLSVRGKQNGSIKLLIMIISEATGNYIFANAAFCQPLQMHLHKIQPLDFAGSILTAGEEVVEYEDCKGKLDFGDTMLICNPAIMEKRNVHNRVFGDSALRDLVEKPTFNPKDSSEILTKVYKAYQSFVSDSRPKEEQAVICIRKTSGST